MQSMYASKHVKYASSSKHASTWVRKKVATCRYVSSQAHEHVSARVRKAGKHASTRECRAYKHTNHPIQQTLVNILYFVTIKKLHSMEDHTYLVKLTTQYKDVLDLCIVILILCWFFFVSAPKLCHFATKNTILT